MEVVCILKKALLLSFSLLFLFCSNLRPCCDFSVEGRRIYTGCTPAAERAARAAAQAAAEEILPGKAQLPSYRRQLRFTLGKRADTAPLLSHALLCSCPEIISGEEVYLDSRPLGTVSSARDFRTGLKRYISASMPTWASSGSVPGQLSFRPQYTRAELEVSIEDMIMLVTGMSRVMYSDGKGRISPV